MIYIYIYYIYLYHIYYKYLFNISLLGVIYLHINTQIRTHVQGVHCVYKHTHLVIDTLKNRHFTRTF